MLKFAIILADCYSENLTPEEDTEHQIFAENFTTRVAYETLIQKGFKVKILRERDNELMEVSRQETDFSDEQDDDDIVYFLKIENLADSDITLKEWNKFLRSIGATVKRI